MRDAIKNAKRIVVKVGEQYIMLPKWSFKFRTDRTFSPSIIRSCQPRERGYSCFLGGLRVQALRR